VTSISPGLGCRRGPARYEAGVYRGGVPLHSGSVHVRPAEASRIPEVCGSVPTHARLARAKRRDLQCPFVTAVMAR